MFLREDDHQDCGLIRDIRWNKILLKPLSVTVCSFQISSIWPTCLDLSFSPYLALTLCQVVCVLMPERYAPDGFPGLGPACCWPAYPGKLLILPSDQVFAAPCLFLLAWVFLVREWVLIWGLSACGIISWALVFDGQRLFNEVCLLGAKTGITQEP